MAGLKWYWPNCNNKTGASVSMRKFPPMIEQIFKAGGLPEFARARYEAELAKQPIQAKQAGSAH